MTLLIQTKGSVEKAKRCHGLTTPGNEAAVEVTGDLGAASASTGGTAASPIAVPQI